jgi:hypothetical protein
VLAESRSATGSSTRRTRHKPSSTPRSDSTQKASAWSKGADGRPVLRRAAPKRSGSERHAHGTALEEVFEPTPRRVSDRHQALAQRAGTQKSKILAADAWQLCRLQERPSRSHRNERRIAAGRADVSSFAPDSPLEQRRFEPRVPSWFSSIAAAGSRRIPTAPRSST